MCGRYAATLPPEMMVELFRLLNTLDYPPRFNIKPTEPIVAIWEQQGRRTGQLVRWGFVPNWAKDPRDYSLMINARAYEALPAQYKAVLEAACAESWHWMSARYDVLNPPAMRRLIAGGAQLRAFPRDVMSASYRATQELYAEIGAQNPRFRRIHEQWDRFRVEQTQWARVAEDSLANFLAVTTAQR